jgi:hypothetical protein
LSKAGPAGIAALGAVNAFLSIAAQALRKVWVKNGALIFHIL